MEAALAGEYQPAHLVILTHGRVTFSKRSRRRTGSLDKEVHKEYYNGASREAFVYWLCLALCFHAATMNTFLQGMLLDRLFCFSLSVTAALVPRI